MLLKTQHSPLFSGVLEDVLVGCRWNPRCSNVANVNWQPHIWDWWLWLSMGIATKPGIAWDRFLNYWIQKKGWERMLGVKGRKRISSPSLDSVLSSPTWSSQIHFVINAGTKYQPLKLEEISNPRLGYKPKINWFPGKNIETEEYSLFDDILVSDFWQKVICKLDYDLSYRTGH